MVPIIDMLAGKVTKVETYWDEPVANRQDNNYHRDLQERPWRTDLKPLNVVQPEVRGFEFFEFEFRIVTSEMYSRLNSMWCSPGGIDARMQQFDE